MSRLDDRLSALSPQKRRLVDMLLKREEAAAASFVAPASALEESLAEIWSQVLGLKRVGAQDNFIALGGDSIRAIQISARARKGGLSFTADQCFRQPTIRQLAAFLEQQSLHTGGVPPPRRSEQVPTVLSFGEERIWLEHQIRDDVPVYNTFMAMRIDGPLQVEVLIKAMHALLQRHDTLRTAYRQEKGELRRVILPDLQPQLSIVEGESAESLPEEARLQQLAREETQKAFDLTQAPLLRCTLVRLSSQPHRHYLILTAHHIICDAWSMGILLVELTRLYEAFVNRLPSPLVPLDIGYAEFAQWQRDVVGSGRLAEQLAYWRTVLQHSPLEPVLPSPRPRPTVRSYRGRTSFFQLPPEVLASIDRFAKGQRVTRYIACLAAYFLVIHSYSKRSDLVVGTPVLGRPLEETEKLVGFFLNTVVLRTRVTADTSIAAFTEQLNEVRTDALRHQDIPYDRVLRELGIERNTAHAPLFQLWFVMQTGKAETLHAADLRLTPVELERATSAFDVALSLQEAEAGLNGWLEYNTDLFDEAFMRQFQGRYELVLQQLESAVSSSVGELLESVVSREVVAGRRLRDELRQRVKQFAPDLNG